MHFWRISNTSLPLRRDQNSRIWAIPFFCCNFWHLFKVQRSQRNDLTTCKTFLKPDNETGWWPWPVFSCLWHNEIVVIRCNSPQFLAGNLFRLSFQTLKCCGGPLRAIFSFVALKWRRFLGEILTIWGSSWEGGVQFLWKLFSIFFIFCLSQPDPFCDRAAVFGWKLFFSWVKSVSEHI